MAGVIGAILEVIDMFLGFVQFMMVLYGIVSLLVFFGVLKPYGRFTQLVWLNMQGIFEPMLRPIRRYVPPSGGFDWAFLILFLFIELTRRIIQAYMPHVVVIAQ